MDAEDPKAYLQNVRAAAQGCGECGGPIRLPASGIPGGDPFSAGRYEGRYLCGDCWTIYYDDHPEQQSDQDSRNFVKQEAKRIRVERGLSIEIPEVLFQEEESRVHLMPNGTLRIQIGRFPGLGSEEYDPARFEVLARAMKAIEAKRIDGFCPAAGSA